jgi:hypothetical protein
MKTFSFLIPVMIFFSPQILGQSFLITQPVLHFDNSALYISYDIVSKSKSDQFYVWVEIKKKNGESVRARSLSGDIGEKINSGIDKKIVWIPEKDSVYLDEDVTVEIKAEKYIKTFNKGSAILMSAALPGLGQTKIYNGKPYWLAGVAAYGAIAGGIIAYNSSMNSYDLYKAEEDVAKREDLYDKAQKQMGASQALIISGAIAWAANIIWVALVPVRYESLKNVNFSLNQASGNRSGTMLLTFRLNF